MNENTNSMTMAADADDWDDITLSDAPEAEPETEAVSEGQPDNEPAEGGTAPETAPEPDTEAAADHSYTLKYMGQERSYTEQEYRELASKGQDYDRIRTSLEELRAQSGENERNRTLAQFVGELAQSQGRTPEELMLATRAALLAQREGISQEEARRRVQFDQRERSIAEREQRLGMAEEQRRSAQEAQERQRQEFMSFFRENPAVKAEDIPKEVYDAVRSGTPLRFAWEAQQRRTELESVKRELEQLRAELETEKQNGRNAARSAPSQSSTGAAQKDDSFDALWYDGN